jgi:large conductance mechanosensitive channel
MAELYAGGGSRASGAEANLPGIKSGPAGDVYDRVSAPVQPLNARYRVVHIAQPQVEGGFMAIPQMQLSGKPMALLEEFRNFALKGNVIDLAVGVIIGAAFGKIVDSLVKHIIMPAVGVLLPGEQGYIGWKYVIGGKEIPYGLFIGEVINFLIVALALYLFIVKFLGLVMKARKAEAAVPPPPARQEVLLTEIRDLLSRRP